MLLLSLVLLRAIGGCVVGVGEMCAAEVGRVKEVGYQGRNLQVGE